VTEKGYLAFPIKEKDDGVFFEGIQKRGKPEEATSGFV